MFVNKTHEKAHQELKNERIEEAVVLYSKALIESPDHADILSDRGVAYLHLNDQTNCFSDLNKALELQPKYSFRYACRAFAKNHFGDIDGAINDYEMAIELDPEDAVAHNNLGLLLEQKGYKKQAKERYERADKLSKQEEQLLNVINEMENPPASSEKETGETVQPKEEEVRTLQSPEVQRDEELSTFKEFKRIFTSKKQFNDFLKFIKNGFKIK